MTCDDRIILSDLQVKPIIIADVYPRKGACYDLICVTS